MLKGTFKYLGSDVVTIRTHSYTYDDSWFLKPSTERNFDLLKLAYYLSLAPSIKEDILDFYDQLGFSYTAKTDYAKEGLNVLAGAKVEDSVYYPAPVVNGKYYINSIGYAIGFKKIEDSTVLLVAIRGGHYGSEWGGNFNIGTGEIVEGFKIAADQVIEGIKTTIKNNNINGDIKILLTGYSRAAATANLCAAFLNQGVIPGIEKENIFGFSFECPRNTRDPEAMWDKYDNIVSVSNPNDIIPKLAESVFGYRRYGRTYYTPGIENDTNFSESLVKMERIEKSIVPFSFQPALNNAYMETVFVNDFAFEFVSLENYVKHYQDCLELLTAVFFGGAKEEVPNEYLAIAGQLQQGLYNLNPVNTTIISKYLGSEPKMVFKLNFMSPILQNHAMELNLSWLESISGFDGFSSNYYKLLYINNADHVTVLDENGTVLTEYKDHTLKSNLNLLYVEVDNNDQLVLQVNPYMNLIINIESEKGNADLTYTRFDQSLGLKDLVAPFELNNLKAIKVEVKNGEDNIPEVQADDKDIKASQIIKGEDVKLYEVRSTLPDKTTGGGYFNYGEFAKVEVMDAYKAQFTGWSVNGKKVSEDPVFKIRVTESLNLTPEFK